MRIEIAGTEIQSLFQLKSGVFKWCLLITRWAGNAYNKLISQDYKPYVCRIWEKPGCFITADGSEDEKFQPKGLKVY